MNKTEPDILVVSAHAADFCSRAGGTLALHARRGSAVHVVDLSFGERGESEDYWAGGADRSEDDAKKVRREEAVEAAGILGVSIGFLDLGDYPLIESRAAIEALAAVMRERRPAILLTHWQCEPFNVDHEAAARMALRAAGIAAVPGFDPRTPRIAPPAMFAFEPTVPRNDATGFRPDHYVDIGETFEVKMRALRALRSQGKLERMYTQWGEYRGAQAAQTVGRPIRYAEAFQRYTAGVDCGLPR